MSLDSLLVSSIMTKDVKTEEENQNIIAACKVMYDNNVGCVVVVENQNKEEKIPRGMVTERDIVNILGKKTIDFAKPLSDFMSKPLISIESSCSIREAIQLMNSKHVRRLVAVDGNKMVGIITEKDIFSQISKSPTMITDFVGQNYPAEYKESYSRFTEYMFDLLPKI